MIFDEILGVIWGRGSWTFGQNKFLNSTERHTFDIITFVSKALASLLPLSSGFL